MSGITGDDSGPEDNAEWLRWAADVYASAVAKGGSYVPEPNWDGSAISPGLRGAADEIECLRARVEVLERVRAAAQALAGYRFGWLGWEEKVEALRVALKEAKP